MSSTFEVQLKREPAQKYESLSREVPSHEIDAFVRESVARLRAEHEPAGRPFAMYMGCDKDDAQLVEVCLPTEGGSQSMPAGDVVYTVARGEQCDYPAILAAYDAVAKYAGETGRAAAGPPREVYLSELDSGDEPAMQIALPLGD